MVLNPINRTNPRRFMGKIPVIIIAIGYIIMILISDDIYETHKMLMTGIIDNIYVPTLLYDS